MWMDWRGRFTTLWMTTWISARHPADHRTSRYRSHNPLRGTASIRLSAKGSGSVPP